MGKRYAPPSTKLGQRRCGGHDERRVTQKVTCGFNIEHRCFPNTAISIKEADCARLQVWSAYDAVHESDGASFPVYTDVQRWRGVEAGIRSQIYWRRDTVYDLGSEMQWRYVFLIHPICLRDQCRAANRCAPFAR